MKTLTKNNDKHTEDSESVFDKRMNSKQHHKMAIVIKNTKDVFFSSERPYMVVTFVRKYNSIFAVGSLEQIKYELKYDLRLIYPQFWDQEAQKYDAEAASKLFIEEFPVGSNECVNLFDFSIKDITDGKHTAVIVHSSRVEMDTWHVACYDTEKEWAKNIALKEIETKIEERKISWAD
ncbi:MAG: hypothetical protein IKP33_01135 [Prevotella sp.]|nr:hypothetical protein [Prevotella sp.]